MCLQNARNDETIPSGV